MPNKKKKSGQGDGYAPSRLGREGRPGADSPAGADPGTPGGGDERALDPNDADAPEREPVPGWSGLGAHAPCDDATRVTLDPKTPVAAGIGVHVHALMSQQLMTRAHLGAGDWVALAVCQGPEAVGDIGSALRGGAPGTPGFAAGGASTPRTPPSPTRQAAQALVGLSIADPPTAPVAHIPSLLARNVRLDPDGTSPLGGEPPSRGASTGAAAAAAAAATGKVGRFTVLARVHPNPKANPADAVQLARKVWMSLGSPPAGAKMLCYPLNVGITDRPVAAPALCAPIEGAPCATNATLRLWATEGDAANAAWLERGLGGDDDDDAVGSKNASDVEHTKAGRRQLSVLESLAKRALEGRALLPGNLVRLPLLGVSAYFSVVKTEGHTAVVSTETSVRLRPKSGLADGEDDPAALESDDDEDDEKDDEKDDSSDDGDGTGSRPATPGERMARRASKRKGAAVRFEDLGGVSEFKEALLENVALPLTRPEIFTTFGIKPPRGVLLWGPPGTGKSRLARDRLSDRVTSPPSIITSIYFRFHTAIILCPRSHAPHPRMPWPTADPFLFSKTGRSDPAIPVSDLACIELQGMQHPVAIVTVIPADRLMLLVRTIPDINTVQVCWQFPDDGHIRHLDNSFVEDRSERAFKVLCNRVCGFLLDCAHSGRPLLGLLT